MTPEKATSGVGKLAGLRVLVVEDQFLLADALGRTLKALGAAVLGPVAGIEAALALVASDRPDLAVLDIDLGGEKSLPVAHELARLDIPWVFVTGYTAAMVPEALADVVRVEKPFTEEMIVAALQEALERGRGR